MNRREFLSAAGSGVALSVLSSSVVGQEDRRRRFKAIAFDAFPIFDPRPIFALTAELFPGKGSELSVLWRNRQFEYTWLRTLTGRYVDFPTVTRDALVFAAKSLKIELPQATRQRLLDTYFRLKTWPDVLPALRQLKDAGLRLGFLSNFSGEMLAANIKGAGLDSLFEKVLSTDQVKAFKPDPRAYRMGIDAFGLKREEIVFAAFAGWDVSGAKSFGYPTFWINRMDAAEEELDGHPDAIGSLDDLVKFVAE
jgi:2-haloacid dehalogenase